MCAQQITGGLLLLRPCAPCVRYTWRPWCHHLRNRCLPAAVARRRPRTRNGALDRNPSACGRSCRECWRLGTVRDEPVLTWCGGNGREGDPSGAMCSSAAAAQSSATRLRLRRVAAQEGERSDRTSNGNAIAYHLAYCCCIPRIYTGLPVFYELAPSSQHGFQTRSC